MNLPSLILAFQAKMKDNQGFNGGFKIGLIMPKFNNKLFNTSI
jgi:hypothetical protein